MFNLEATLFCGQAFGWKKENSTYQAVLDNRLITLDQENPFSTITKDPYLNHYFDMEYPYAEAESVLQKKDSHLASLITAHVSIHILNQDPFQTMISFITSQNNTIKRIRSLLEKLSQQCGREVEEGLYSFPTADELLRHAGEDTLRSLGFGYRSPYIIEAARSHNLLEEVARQDDEESARTLQRILGIGAKVAACILLFGFGRKDVFPLDTWTKKIMKKYYPTIEPSFFSPYGGIAQQHLFYHERQMIEAHW